MTEAEVVAVAITILKILKSIRFWLRRWQWQIYDENDDADDKNITTKT